MKIVPFRGAGESRTRVQTRYSYAFYMLISGLLVGNRQDQNKPTASVAS